MPGLIIIVALLALLWFVLIRPQRARQQAQRRTIQSVAAGDEVLTVGGLYGIVQEIDEEGDLIVEVAEGVHVRVARRGVASIVKPDADDEADEADDETDEAGQEDDTAATVAAGSAPDGADADEKPLHG